MSKHGSPTDTIRAIMSGQLNEHAPLHIDPPYDVALTLQVLHDNGVPSATRVDDKTISVAAGDQDMANRVLTNALNKGAIPAPITLISAEGVGNSPGDVPVTNPVSEAHYVVSTSHDNEVFKSKTFASKKEAEDHHWNKIQAEKKLPTKMRSKSISVVKEEAQLKPDETHVNSDYEVVRSLINKKENQLKKIDEVSRGTLQSYASKAHRSAASHRGKAGRAADDSNYHSNGKEEANANAAKSLKHHQKADKREAGLSVAYAKLGEPSRVKAKVRATEAVSYVVEKIEQINELSKNTLRNYIVKASAEHGAHSWMKGQASGIKSTEKHDSIRSALASSEKVHGKIADKRFAGIAKAAHKMTKEDLDFLDESVKDLTYSHSEQGGEHHHKAEKHLLTHGETVKKHTDAGYGNTYSRVKLDGHHFLHMATSDGFSSITGSKDGMKHLKSSSKSVKLSEDTIDLTEGKKEDLAKSSKAFAAHPRADKMFQDMHHAAKTCNYITDACDHVYNNHRDHIKYSEWHDMKPHIEAHFKERGLEG